jgi:hypothetical protein
VKVCPTSACIGLHGSRAGGYKEAGDAHFFAVVFEREQPQYPGLIFEQPSSQGPASVKSGKAQYFRRNQRYERFHGKIFYVVLLDTASSVLEKAEADFERVLKSVEVE